MNFDENALNGFMTFLKNYADRLIEEGHSIDEQLDKIRVIRMIGENPTAEELLKEKDYISRFSPEIADKIRVISFYAENDALDAEQVESSVATIVNDEKFKLVDKESTLCTQREQIATEQEKLKKVIEHQDYDFTYLLELLEISTLSDEEKLEILAKEAYDSCFLVPVKEATTTKEQDVEELDSNLTAPISDNTESISDTEVISEEQIEQPVEEVLDIASRELSEEELEERRQLQEKFAELKKKIDSLTSKYSYLIEGKTSKEKEYARNLAKLYVEATNNSDEESIDNNDFLYPKEAMTTMLFEMMEYRDLLDEQLFDQKDNQLATPFNAEEVSFCTEEIENILKQTEKVEKQIAQDDQETKDTTPSKLVYLLDTNGNLLFDIEQFSSTDKEKIETIIERTEDGTYTKQTDSKRLRLISSTPVKYNVYALKSSRMSASYIRATDDTILVLDFGPITEIFQNAKRIIERYEDEIDSMLSAIQRGDKEVFAKNQIIQDQITASLSKKEGAKK